MSPGPVIQLKTATEALDAVKCPGFRFEAGEVVGAVYVQAIPLGMLYPASRLFFLEERMTRISIARMALEAVKWSVSGYLAENFAVDGHFPFIGGGTCGSGR
jgi:hypothetical protein